MQKLKAVCLILLSLVVGIFFTYSAYTKLYTLESFQAFEFSIIEYLHVSWGLATFTSRFIVGLELALGIAISLLFYGNKKWILKLALMLLGILSAYLIFLWISAGNNINCGCFGDAIWMSPASSLIKNILLAASLFLLLRYRSGNPLRFSHTISPLLLFIITSVPFFVFPKPDTQPRWLEKSHFKLDLSALEKTERKTKVDSLRNGKHIIAFMSLGCPHCRTAAHKMHLMKVKNPALPFYIVLAGKDENLKAFWDQSNARHIHHARMNGDDFTSLVGFSWPVIYWVNDGWVEAQTNYLELDQAEIEKWIGQEK